jgi:hypothetical protein
MARAAQLVPALKGSAIRVGLVSLLVPMGGVGLTAQAGLASSAVLTGWVGLMGLAGPVSSAVRRGWAGPSGRTRLGGPTTRRRSVFPDGQKAPSVHVARHIRTRSRTAAGSVDAMRSQRLTPTVRGTRWRLPIPVNEAMFVRELIGLAAVMRIALVAVLGHGGAPVLTVPASEPTPGSAIPRGRTT